jgi:hypothetical protein
MKEKVEAPVGCCEHYFGERGKGWGEKIEKCVEYAGSKPNPFFQAVYLTIMCAWFWMYYRYGWGEESATIRPLADEVPGGLDLHMRIMEIGFGMGVLLLIQVYRVDPGRVTEENKEDFMRYYKKPDPARGEAPLKWCNTCRFLRPPRTHHCRMCDICVVRFDHHCVWLNTCIGAQNLRWFLAFVAWHALLCFYGVGFVFALLRVIAAKLHAQDPMVLEWLGQRRFNAYMRFIPHTWGALGSMIGNAANTDIPWAVVWATNVPLMILMIFCMIMGAVLGSFFCVHVMQVLRNQTSYEGWTYVAKLPAAADAEEEGKEATGEEGGAAEGASDGAESCTPPPAPTGKAKRSAAADESVEAEAASDGGRTRGEGAEKKEKDEKKEEEEDDDDDEPDRGSTCRIKRQTPAELDAGSSLPPGEWVATHDTGSKWTNLLEVIFPPLTYGFPAGPTHEKDD